MSNGMRRALLAAGGLALALFAGRWTATTLADRWWGLAVSPAAAQFLTGVNLLRLTLDLAGVVIASAWFTGNLLVVYRAIGGVEVSRQIANLEVREALTQRTLLAGTVVLGLILGLVTGGDVSRHWRVIALAWQGVQFDLTEPILGHDVGLYVAQLPLWSLLHDYALALALTGLLVVVLLYAVIGAIRWIDGRPAISDHARRHLGWLLGALALVLGWGLLLEPHELVSGVLGEVGTRQFQLATLTSPALAGTALMVAVVSLLWAVRISVLKLNFLLLAGWAVLGIGWVLTRIAVGSLVVPGDVALGDMASRRSLDAAAYHLASLHDSLAVPWTDAGTPPAWPSLWQTEPLVRIGDADSLLTAAADPAWIMTPAGRRPAWLLLVTSHDSVASLRAVADDRTSATGGPLFYHPDDSVPAPAPAALLHLSDHALYPGAARVVISDDVRGVPVGGLPRRVALAWALQERRLLGTPAPDATVDWVRAPQARLAKLAPYAEWAPPVPRVDGGRLVWISDGYLVEEHFPLSTRASLSGRSVGMLHAGFVGVVEAEEGETHIYARPDAGPVADAWMKLAAGVVEPWDAVPVTARPMLPYPAELFLVQSRILENAETGVLAGRADSLRVTPPVSSFFWMPASADGPARTAEYVRGSTGQLQTLLVGSSVEGRLALVQVEIDSSVALPGPAGLEQRWERFATFVQVLDSVRAGGGMLSAGGVRYWVSPGAVGATQSRYGPRGGGGSSVTWISVASGPRVGAARTFGDAWTNLRGASVPRPTGALPSGALIDARRWFRVADSAFRRGDFTAFGRAFEELRAALEVAPVNPR
jgi:hypothetical protein